MANTKQAKKRTRQSEKNRQRNASLRSMYRTAIKKAVAAIETKQKPLAEEAFKTMTSVVDKMVNKKIIHKNKAARHKSRLSAKIKALV